MFCSRSKGKVLIHAVLKFESFYKNNAAKYWDKVESILYQKLKGKIGSLLIDFSTFRFSGKTLYAFHLLVWCFFVQMKIVFLSRNII